MEDRLQIFLFDGSMWKLKTLFWILALFLVVPSIVNAFSEVLGDYFFVDRGDDQINNSIVSTPANNSDLTDQGWQITEGASWIYCSDKGKIGNMSLCVTTGDDITKFKLEAGGVSGKTIQFTIHDDKDDVSGLWFMTLRDDTDASTLGQFGVTTGISTTLYRYSHTGASDMDTGVKRTNKSLNFTFEIAPGAAYIAGWINRSDDTPDPIFNDTTTSNVAVIRLITGIFIDVQVEIYVWDGAPQDRPLATPLVPTFTVTVNDTYDGTLIQNFTLTVFNSTDAFTNSTSSGSIVHNNLSGRYNINISSNETGGYFNRTFLNISIDSDFQADIFQSVLRLVATDSLNNESITSFTAQTNRSLDSTTNGQILILAKNGTFQLNVSALGFDNLVTNFTLATLENGTLNVSMGSVFSFFLVRETTNDPFNANLTNSTELNIFCPNQTININMTSSPNASQVINCEFTLMQVVVSYGGIGSYFRTLIPPSSQKNVTFYLIDLLQGDTAIQRIIKLFDITGEFANAKLTVKRAVGGIIRTIIEQRFDLASETNLFLIKDALYTLDIDNDQEVIILGNLIPTEAGTQTITLPKIDFVPTEIVLGGNISWAYTFNATQGILRLKYTDKTNLTTIVKFTVFNGSEDQVFQATSDSNSTVTFTFNQVVGNASYRSELFFDHPGLSNHTDKKIFYGFLGGGAGALDLEGWTIPEQQDIKKWFAFIFLFFWGLLFSRIHAGIAMTSTAVFLWLFRIWEWIIISDVVFGFVVLIAVIAWIVEAMKRN